jgi:PAS domain S-box-containing protein
LIESSDDAIISEDLRGRIVTWNPGAERLLGYPACEAIGRSIAFLCPADLALEIEHIRAQIHRSERVLPIVTAWLRRDGERIALQTVFSPICDARSQIVGLSVIARDAGTIVENKDGHDKPVRIMGVNMDVTERKLAEEALRASEGRFRTLADTAPVLIWMSGTDKACTWFNKRWLEFTGRSMEQECGAGWTEGVHADDLKSCLDTYLASFDARVPFTMEYRLRRNDGEYRWVLDIGIPITGGAGGFAGYIGSALDITDRIQAERALRRKEEEFEALAENSPLVIARFDLGLRHLYVNRAIERVTGLARARFIQQTHRSLGLPEDLCALWEGKLRETIEARSDVDFEFSYDGPFGRRDFYSRLVPEFSSDARMSSILGVCADITERKALQAELLSIAEREQQRIGQDLHDDVGQELTGIALMADALVDALEEAGSAEAQLGAKIRARLAHTRERIRGLASSLIPVEVDARGLMSALEELAIRVGAQSGIDVAFQCPVTVHVGDNLVATQLYRITQEAIANAIKHGRARHIDVELRQENGTTTLEVRDDGTGLMEKSRRGNGMGLRIMQYRAGLLGAALEVMSASGSGTRVVCKTSGGLGNGRS